MEQKRNDRNWFTRVLLLLIAGFIAAMIGYKYFYVDPKADISGGLITLVSLLIVLVLSEVFDSFSIGEIFKLSREVKEKEKEVEKKEKEVVKAETEKKEILSQLISLSTTVSQRQSNTNIYGLPHEAFNQPSVKPAEAKETEELKRKEAQEEKRELEKEVTPTQTRKSINNSRAKELALRKFMIDNGLDFSKVYKEMKIQAFQGIDPVSDRSPIFDAYLTEIDREIFFEVRPQRLMFAGFLSDRIYVMLSKIYHYRAIKKNNVYLQLILIKYPQLENTGLTRLFEYFEAALNNNLLKISVVEFSEEEAQSVSEDILI